jgi:hypothetical protein
MAGLGYEQDASVKGFCEVRDSLSGIVDVQHRRRRQLSDAVCQQQEEQGGHRLLMFLPQAVSVTSSRSSSSWVICGNSSISRGTEIRRHGI